MPEPLCCAPSVVGSGEWGPREAKSLPSWNLQPTKTTTIKYTITHVSLVVKCSERVIKQSKRRGLRESWMLFG